MAPGLTLLYAEPLLSFWESSILFCVMQKILRQTSLSEIPGQGVLMRQINNIHMFFTTHYWRNLAQSTGLQMEAGGSWFPSY